MDSGSLLTKRCNNGTCDAVGHTDGKDAHGPGVLQAKLELIGLALQVKTQTHLRPERNLRSLARTRDREGSAYPLYVNAFSLGLGKAEAERVHRQRRDAEQLHRGADQAGCDHVVYKKSTVVRKKHTPGIESNKTRDEC